MQIDYPDIALSRFFPRSIKPGSRAMVFVDGENFTIRYGKMLGVDKPARHVRLEPNIFLWSNYLNKCLYNNCEVVRKYFYTAVQGDEKRRAEIEDKLIEYGIEAPRVFKKTKQRGSKRVDISLATDMLTHAHRKNYDVAVLVAGDEDYVPLVEAVMAEGRRVVLWFVQGGLSPALRKKVDHFGDLGLFLFQEDQNTLNAFAR
jgi:uncharacterized LabA/DUF88 family protein